MIYTRHFREKPLFFRLQNLFVTAKMNEKYNEDWTTYQLEEVYRRNKHLLSDEEE